MAHGLTDLIEQVDRLATPSHEVAGGHLRLLEDGIQSASLSP